jgi:hypothetical protein
MTGSYTEPAAAPAAAAPMPDPLIGRRLGSYEVLSMVARGGMGVVYRARHVYMGRVVALKVLNPELARRTDLLQRFRVEAQSLARVEHDNVVKVLDIFESGGVHCIVMDFAEGSNLHQRVKARGPLTAHELLSVARQTAEALEAAHREGILHRDIKPENLIMDAQGRCKLADFGLAGDLRMIREGQEGPLTFGTPAYSAPEVLRRYPADRRSDVFSYGATLFFLAMAQPPFGQRGVQNVLLEQKNGPPDLAARRPELPLKFTALVGRCLAWHPKDRPADFREILSDMGAPPAPAARREAVLPQVPAPKADEAAASREHPVRVSRWVWLAAALAVLLGGAALAHALWPWGADPAAPRAPEPAAQTPEAPKPPEGVSIPLTPLQPALPAWRPVDDAFHAAELDARAALARADYAGAAEVWAQFIGRYPEGERASKARARRADVFTRVRERRGQELARVLAASDEALAERRTAEALAVLGAFPQELLQPLGGDDLLEVAQALTAQRDKILREEQRDLDELLRQAARLRTLRERGLPGREGRREWTMALLDERGLLAEFLPGRTTEARRQVSARLEEVRALLAAASSQARATADQWRDYADHAVPRAARDAVQAADAAFEAARLEQFAAARDQLAAAAAGLTRSLQAHPGHAQDGARLAESLAARLEQIARDVAQAEAVVAVLETQLRVLARSAAVGEYSWHAEREADGSRSARLNRATGRVIHVDRGYFEVEGNGTRHRVPLDMLTLSTARRVARATTQPGEQLTLVLWLVCLGRTDEAGAEQARLERMDMATEAERRRGRAAVDAGVPGADALRRLLHVAARAETSLAERLPQGSLEARLTAAQRAVESGGAQANDYLALLRDLREPDPLLVHLAAFERAIREGEPRVADLRTWAALEPREPRAGEALAQGLWRNREPGEAAEAALNALALDPSLEAAWELLRRMP